MLRKSCRRRRRPECPDRRARNSLGYASSSFRVCAWVEADSPKKYARMSLSTPMTSKPASTKWRTDSDPTSPPDPVTIATGIAGPSSRVNAISENRCPAMRNGDEGDRARIRGRHLHREPRVEDPRALVQRHHIEPSDRRMGPPDQAAMREHQHLSRRAPWPGHRLPSRKSSPHRRSSRSARRFPATLHGRCARSRFRR